MSDSIRHESETETIGQSSVNEPAAAPSIHDSSHTGVGINLLSNAPDTNPNTDWIFWNAPDQDLSGGIDGEQYRGSSFYEEYEESPAGSRAW